MTQPDALTLLPRLEAALAVPGLPARAAATGAALADALRRPVRIGLFGLPGSGKEAAAADLLGAVPFAPGHPWPTIALRHGAAAEATLLLEDGSRLDRPGPPDPSLLDERPILIEARVPLDALAGRSLLILNAGPDELDPALRWAAARCDMALWVSRGWTDAEAATWRRAPDALRNHAILVATGDAPLRPDPSCGFQSVCTASRLCDAVEAAIADARAEDAAAAALFLQRHGPDEAAAGSAPPTAGAPHAAHGGVPVPRAAHAPAAPLAAPAPAGNAPATSAQGTDADPLADTPPSGLAPAVPGPTAARGLAETGAERPADPSPIPLAAPAEAAAPQPCPPPFAYPVPAVAVDPAARAALCRAFNGLRMDAEALLEALPPDGPLAAEDLEALQDGLEATIDRLVDHAGADADDPLAEAWPDIRAALLDAQDLALLLRMEGGSAGVMEGCALLLQLRTEMETALAA